MRKERATPVTYYDSLSDELSGITRPDFEIGPEYPFLGGGRLWRGVATLVYRGIMTPLAAIYCQVKFGLRFEGREKLRACPEQGRFVYSNHTLMAGDAFIPSLSAFPRRTYVVVNADNVALKATRQWIMMSGALPIPTTLSGMKPFLEALETRAKQGASIQIYPEAHIWPYYTGIRPFAATSFRYPARLGLPVFCTTTTYHKRFLRRTPGVTVCCDGPFFPDMSLPLRQREQVLRDAVYDVMCLRAKKSTYEAVRYLPRPDAQPSPKNDLSEKKETSVC